MTLNLNTISDLVNNLEKRFNEEIILDEAIFIEAIEKTNNYLDSLNNPSDYKIAGTITFWIRKLKPFHFQLKENSKNPHLRLNELIAILFGYSHVRISRQKKRKKTHTLPEKFLADVTIQMRYSSFSPSSLASMFESMYLLLDQEV